MLGELTSALRRKSGVRVSKGSTCTYNSGWHLLGPLSVTPTALDPPQIQCDGFKPHRPHGGAFDSVLRQICTEKYKRALSERSRARATLYQAGIGKIVINLNVGAPARRPALQFVVHALDKEGALATRAKFYRQHRIHLDEAGTHGVGVITAGTLVAEDGETPVGSLFVVDAENRTALDAFTRSDPYYLNGVWGIVEIHAYRKKRGS